MAHALRVLDSVAGPDELVIREELVPQTGQWPSQSHPCAAVPEGNLSDG